MYLNKPIIIYNPSHKLVFDIKDDTKQITLNKYNKLNNNQKFIISKYNERDIIIKSLNSTEAITLTSIPNEIIFYLKKLEAYNYDQVFTPILNNNNIIFNNPCKNKTIDWSPRLKILHGWEQMPNNVNQIFKIIPYFKNNDNNDNHIIPKLQNLILTYIDRNININTVDDYYTILFDPKFREKKPQQIAQEIISINSQSSDSSTKSAYWCPLIYNALKIGGINVIDEWTKFKIVLDKEQEFNELSRLLASIPGWIDYTMYILTELDHTKTNIGNDFNDKTIKKMIEIRNIIYPSKSNISKIKYLKYKMKYIKLKELEKQINNTN